MKRYVLSLLLLLSLSLSLPASSLPRYQRLFATPDNGIPYRIPAIATTRNGTLIAVADYRYCYGDIGYGAVDLHYRLSYDNGKTWTGAQVLADGTGDDAQTDNMWTYAYGDCALVADRTSDEVVAMCVAGKTVYSQARRENPNRVALFRSHDGGKTWDKGRELTDQIYSLFDKRTEGPVNSLFIGSGKIHQSRYVKVDKYYRLYAALCTLSGNFVIFSDDLGDTWSVLGDPNVSPARDGDEPKCEELPDGSVILSSRYWGRLFNIFTFTDAKTAAGHWEQRFRALDMADIQNVCNGEIMLVEAIRKTDNSSVWVALQTVPFGPGRTNVGYFYHELIDCHEPAYLFAWQWKRGLQLSHQESAYSTFTLQADNRFGVLWEEGPTYYNIDYCSLSLEDITGGEYTLKQKFRN